MSNNLNLIKFQAAGLTMLFHETVAVEAVTVEKDQPCLYCNKSDYVVIGVSSSIVGIALLILIACFVAERIQRKRKGSHKAASDRDAVEDGEKQEFEGLEMIFEETAAVWFKLALKYFFDQTILIY